MAGTYNPYTATLDMQRRAWEDAAEVVEKMGSAPEAAETIQEVDVGETPSEVVYEENKLELLHYDPEAVGVDPEDQYDVPILIVYALINRPYILDLQPGRSVVRTLLENGFDVYLIDWGEPSKLDRSLGLEDYVDRYMDNCVDVVRERSGQDSIDVLGYCMGGTMSVMYASLHREKIRNLALMAAGLCFDDTGGVLELWGDEEYFDPDEVTDTFGNVPAEFLDVGFALMDPVANTVTKYVRLYENMDDEDFIENFARMEEWLGDGIDVAGRAFEQFIEDVYQDNELYRNELELDGKQVDLNELDMPILQIVAEYDHLIPPEASKPFNETVPSDDTTVMEFSTGHIGMSVSSKSHAELWPDVCEWFEDHQDVPAGDAVSVDIEEPGTAESGTTTDDAAGDDGPTSGTEAEHEDPAGGEPSDLETIDGIGPSYAGRLREAGIGTVADLADADDVAVADETGIAPSRVEDWIDRARDLAGD